MKKLELKIEQKEQELINTNYDHKIQIERDILVKRLHKHIEERNVGAKLRSRAKWVEQGEKSSKYFYNLEKKNFSSNIIKQLKKENGTYTTCDNEILHE